MERRKKFWLFAVFLFLIADTAFSQIFSIPALNPSSAAGNFFKSQMLPAPETKAADPVDFAESINKQFRSFRFISRSA